MIGVSPASKARRPEAVDSFMFEMQELEAQTRKGIRWN